MEKDDARYSTLEQLHERRKQVVRLHRKGYGVMQIVELSGLSYPTVRAAIDRYEEIVMMQKWARDSSPWEGMKESLSDYVREVENLGDQFRNFADNGIRNLEDALTDFTATGKLNFKYFVDSIIRDLSRIAIKQAITGTGGAWSHGHPT